MKHLLVSDHFELGKYLTFFCVQILLCASFKHILINITTSVGVPDSVRILCIMSLTTKSESFLKGVSG
jgi:hypothetical protein